MHEKALANEHCQAQSSKRRMQYHASLWYLFQKRCVHPSYGPEACTSINDLSSPHGDMKTYINSIPTSRLRISVSIYIPHLGTLCIGIISICHNLGKGQGGGPHGPTTQTRQFEEWNFDERRALSHLVQCAKYLCDHCLGHSVLPEGHLRPHVWPLLLTNPLRMP